MPPAVDNDNCNPPFLFYTCSANGFTGCCTKDPCGISWCPDFPEPADKPFMSSAPGLTRTGAQGKDVDPQTIEIASTQAPQFSSKVDLPSSQSPLTEDVLSSTVMSTSSPSASMSTSDNLVIIFATSETFVTAQATTPSAHGIALSPSTAAVTITMLSSMSVTTRTHTHTPTTTVFMAAPSVMTVSVTAKPRPSYAKRHQEQIVAGSLGSLAGLCIAVGLIWLAILWNRRRHMTVIRERQFDDDPSMAGRDANRAGEYFSKDEGEVFALNTTVPSNTS